MSERELLTFFFVHIMKTGGGTLEQHMYANFRGNEIYPIPKVDDRNRAWMIHYLLGLPPERRAETRVYTGHFPFVVSRLLGIDVVTLTVVRHPVERTISYLKHCKRYHEQHRELPLDQIYRDELHFRCFIHNHQSKIFSMTMDDPLESYMDVIDIDEHRLGIAKENLEAVDVLGLHERYDEFIDALRQRFGWRFNNEVPNRHVGGEQWEVPPGLRRRIADDNWADMAFYEHAQQLYERRSRPQTLS
jgi:hypothetical protein